MIPILFAPKTREYDNNGLGVLVDVGYCIVTEERNGAFELELQYPVNGSHYADLGVDCQILAKPNETSEPQAFRIYNISKPMNGVVTVSAEHISYELSSVVVSPFSASNVGEALSKIKTNSITENRFEFWTDKNTVANMSHATPLSVRSLLGGVEGSILDVYTGEYEFDNYTVKLHQNRGADNGVTIAYAKNLTGVKCEERSDGIVTGAIAYWTKETDGIAQTVYGDLQTINTELSYSRNVLVDCSAEFDNEPTKSQLNQYAEKYIAGHKNTPYFSVSVEFVNLGDTEEYKQYKGLYRVKLCDIVTVKHPLYGINVKAKVVKTVFDSVREKYEKIEIGEISANISQTISAQEKEIAQKVGFSELDKAVEKATSAIGGNKGGYVVLYPSAVNPQELLILDKPNINEATNVWRWNLAGLGHSSTGYNGDFTTAITADGQIVADFITTGTLDASLIKAGVLSSRLGMSTFSLDTGELQVGGDEYNTKIINGEIQQHCQPGEGFVGGMSVGGGREIAETAQHLYYNKDNSRCEGVVISSSHQGSLSAIALFNENFIKLYKDIESNSRYRINGKTAIQTNELDYMVFGSSAGTTSLWGETVWVTTSTGSVNITSPKFICLGKANTGLDGYKVLISGNTFADGDIFANGNVSGATITNRSDRNIKKNVKPTKTKSALSAVKSLNIYDYDLKHNGESVKMGLMADEAPSEILSTDGKGINLYSYCGMLAMAIKQLSDKIDNFEKGGKHHVGDIEQKT